MRSPKKNIDEFFQLGCSWGKRVRGNYVIGCGDSLSNEVTTINLTAAAVAVS